MQTAGDDFERLAADHGITAEEERQREISRKGAKASSIPVKVGPHEFPSQSACAKFFKTTPSTVSRLAREDNLDCLLDPAWLEGRNPHRKMKPKIDPEHYDADGNLLPDEYLKRLEDFRERQAERRRERAA